jgi:hypothetical protein
LALCHGYDVRGPCVKRRTFLTRPIVALLNRGNAFATPADMVQHAFGHLKPHAKALQSGGGRSAQIMRRPRTSGAGFVPASATALARAA